MRRREFIALLSGTAAWPLVAHAQQPAKLPIVGVIGADASVWGPWIAAFTERLRQLGWMEGRTVAFEYRWNEGRPERITEFATEFVRLKVDAIVTAGGEAIMVKRVTSDIPIVFAISDDPVADGLVVSLARPGGNVTGLSVQDTDLAGKRLQLLHEVVPHLRQVAVMANVGYPDALLAMRELQARAAVLGLEIVPLEIRRGEDIGPALDALKQAEALYLVQDALVAANRTRIITLAIGKRLPTMFNSRDYVQAGGLISYGPNFPALFRRTAELVDKILRGARPSDIPVEQPTKFDLVVNLTTAKALNLAIPEDFLARADVVIE
ncbi:MAG: ABC transporter substrate-binding protein [Xanthobacteraceae bacterium]